MTQHLTWLRTHMTPPYALRLGRDREVRTVGEAVTMEGADNSHIDRQTIGDYSE